MLAHPLLAERPCRLCVEYLFDDYEEVGGPILLRPARTGLPQSRHGQPPPCDRCPKIPRGKHPHPANAAGWTEERHHEAWEHYRLCKLTGRWPDDPLVERHALIFAGVEARIERTRQEKLERLFQLAVLSKAVPGG
jgi:hypothetical protein